MDSSLPLSKRRDSEVSAFPAEGDDEFLDAIATNGTPNEIDIPQEVPQKDSLENISLNQCSSNKSPEDKEPTMDSTEVFSPLPIAETPDDSSLSVNDLPSKALDMYKRFGTLWTEVHSRTQDGRLLALDIMKFLQEKATLDEQYAHSLAQLTRLIRLPPTESSKMSHVVNSFTSAVSSVATSRKECADFVRKDVVAQTLRATINNHSSANHRIYNDANTIMTEQKTTMKDFNHAMVHYCNSFRKAEELTRQAQNSKYHVAAYKTEAYLAALTACTGAHMAETSCAAAATVYNERCSTIKPQLDFVLRAFADMDRKRILCTKDALRKWVIFEISNCRNMQYDLERLAERIESLDVDADIAEFSATAPTTSTTFPALNFVPWPDVSRLIPDNSTDSWMTADVPSTPKGFGVNRIAHVLQSAATKLNIRTQPDPPPRTMSHLPAPPSQHIINNLQGECEQVTELLLSETPSNRTLAELVASVADYSLKRSVFMAILEDMTKERPNISLSMYSLRKLGKALSAILSKAEIQGDIWTGLISLQLGKCFKAKGPKAADPQQSKFHWDTPPEETATTVTPLPNEDASEKDNETDQPNDDQTPNENDARKWCWWHLQRTLYHHSFWNRVTFWEEALVVVISEELQRLVIARKTNAQIELSRKWAEHINNRTNNSEGNQPINVDICPQTPSQKTLAFAQHMMEYGIGEPQIKALITKVCRRFGLETHYAEKLSTVSRITESCVSINADVATS